MKQKIFYILILFFIIASYIPVSANGHTNTRQYCSSLIDSSRKEEKRNPAKALEYLNEAQLVAETNNYGDLLIIVLNNKGIIYFALLDYDLAMEYYLAAYKITLEQDDKKGAFIVLNNIGIVYGETNQYAKAIEYLEKAYPVAEQLNDSNKIIMLAVNLAISFHAMEKPDGAIKYLNAVSDILQDNPDEKWSIYLNTEKANNLYLRKEYDAAETLALKVLQQYRNIENKYNSKLDYRSVLFLCLSKIYQAKGNREKAFYFGQEAVKANPILPERIHIFKYMSDLYQQFNFPVLALQYKDSLIMAKDSLHKINIKDNLESNQVKIELLNSENRLAENKAKQKNERILFISLFVFIAILAIILIWVFRIQSIRNKQRKQITDLELEKEKNQKLILEQYLKKKETLTLLKEEQLTIEKLRLEQQLKEQETSALLKQERLNNEIEVKNKQLTAQILSHSNKHEWISEMLNSLLEIPEKSRDSLLDSIIRNLKMQQKDSSEWETFLNYLEEINPSLLIALQHIHPNLTSNDIQLIFCIYLDLDTKKIAHLLNVSIETCRKKKQRLSDKIGIKVPELRNYFKKMENNFSQ